MKVLRWSSNLFYKISYEVIRLFVWNKSIASNNSSTATI